MTDTTSDTDTVILIVIVIFSARARPVKISIKYTKALGQRSQHKTDLGGESDGDNNYITKLHQLNHE